jgi:hypothetical protein
MYYVSVITIQGLPCFLIADIIEPLLEYLQVKGMDTVLTTTNYRTLQKTA